MHKSTSLKNYLIERISNKKLKIKGKGRIYNPSKPPGKICSKVVGSLYKKQFPKESKPTRRIRKVNEAPEGSAQIYLKHEPNDYEVPQVNRDRFSDFINDYDVLQKNKQTHYLQN